eukprot:TRINITY_DN815_c0_g1_i3.p1 TRINITY_DN815_c0_g1~~TRINITY_DN815_c0_g1_i3.p1  ORF type:complete len:805 (-),score=121.04 TRINITY_DN815_c0_g1_i3:103-2517(-)
MASSSVPCFGCRGLIVGTSVGPPDRRYHTHCFTCSQCAHGLGASFFKTRDRNERLLCEPCYKQLYSERCFACSQPIMGTKMVALGRTYHPEHFVCRHCQVQLSQEFYPGVDGHPYCAQHLPQASAGSGAGGSPSPLPNQRPSSPYSPQQQQYTPSPPYNNNNNNTASPPLGRMCSGCKQRTTQPTPLLMHGNYYHDDCYRCATCNTHLESAGAFSLDSTTPLLCKSCYISARYPKQTTPTNYLSPLSSTSDSAVTTSSHHNRYSQPAPAQNNLTPHQYRSENILRHSSPHGSLTPPPSHSTSPLSSPRTPRSSGALSTLPTLDDRTQQHSQSRIVGASANASQILHNDGRNRADLPDVLRPGRKSRKALNTTDGSDEFDIYTEKAKADLTDSHFVDAAPVSHLSLATRQPRGEVDPLEQWTEQNRMLSFAWPKNEEPRDTSLISGYEWPVELGSPYVSGEDVQYSHIEREQCYYRDFLHKDPHQHYFVLTGPESPPAILTIETKSGRKEGSSSLYRALLRTERGDERVVLTIPSSLFSSGEKARLQHLKFSNNVMKQATTVKKVKDPALSDDLLEMERKQNNTNFKFGVLYCKPGQMTEEEMYNNAEGSPAFEEFLKFIGDKIPLVGHIGYAGGLAVFDDSTGKHSIYTRMREFEIMFHVSTYIPITPDIQQVARKRHLGNDIVVIIFKDGTDGNDSFTPEGFKSHFNHIFAVVQPVPGSVPTSYKLAIMYKPGVKPNKPFLPYPAIFKKDESFRTLLLTKLINAEISSMSSPEFLTSMRRTRKEILTNIVQKYKPRMCANIRQ